MTNSDSGERAQRILDAAAELFVYYGYDKTTVSDIARAAGISKGAIYLEFEGKDALFEALMFRELASYAQNWFALIDADPHGGTIGGMYKNSLYALSENAFVSAMFKQDRRVLGTYLRKPDNLFRAMRDGQETSSRLLFVQMMQEAGAMRDDIEPRVIAHIMDMLAYGLVAVDDIVPAEQAPPMEEVIEGIAELMDRALTPAAERDNEAGKAIIRQIAAATQQQFETMNAASHQDDGTLKEEQS